MPLHSVGGVWIFCPLPTTGRYPALTVSQRDIWSGPLHLYGDLNYSMRSRVELGTIWRDGDTFFRCRCGRIFLQSLNSFSNSMQTCAEAFHWVWLTFHEKYNMCKSIKKEWCTGMIWALNKDVCNIPLIQLHSPFFCVVFHCRTKRVNNSVDIVIV